MSVRLALDLDHDAIRLLSQQSDGWVVEGVAELDSEDLPQKIGGLRQRAEDLGGPDPAVLLVLPRSEILYVCFDGLEDPEREVPERLEGLTPYALSDITWDHATSEGRTDVAAVALQTLDEALAFAASSRFRVVGLTSEPPEGEFPRLPVFQRLPGFLRGAATSRPLVLEPDRPPERPAVAFSDQRDADYGPTRVRLNDAAERSRKAVAGLPASLMALVGLVPKPLLGAAAVGAAAVLGTALWPEGDPDPFTKRNLDLSFTELPAAEREWTAIPAQAEGPGELAHLEPVTVLRDPPAIVVPVVIGASAVRADYNAAAAPSGAFERLAELPALFGETRLPAAGADRPAVLAKPVFPQADAPGASRISRAAAPQPLPSPAATEPAPKVASVDAREFSRAPSVLPGQSDVPAPPAPIAPVATPEFLAAAPTEGAPPRESPAAALATAPVEWVGRPAERTALPPASGLVAALPDAAMALLPPSADQRFEIGPDGFVVATPEGTETPGGVLAVAGEPPAVAPPRPGTDAEQIADNGTPSAEPPSSAEPSGVAVTRANPNPELAAFLPRPRPALAPADAVAETQVPEEVIAEALELTVEPEPAEPVMTVSLVPRPRPERPSASVQTATATRAAPAAPRIPSRANVAREATIENALPLNQLNLVGVYGSASNRRALVRLPSGRFVKLKVGDRLDGGQVAQIGSNRLLYQKGSRTLALEMPNT